ncbi:bactericidal permeability-increasing protein-like [Pygocentrus nattereri]|uniref:Bactericidal permeability-increasing protein n=1 Tax=Pygocentrus nattereri TaxID=42514 RepID=A0A3B4DST3_PYGNA|nr:bactericidal permeability-increasing protein-like [Pygocentrus nattereri]
MKMLLVALLLISTTQTHAEDSALQAVLSQKGLQTVTHWLTDWLQNELGNITLPAVKGSVFIIFGSVEYVLYNMSIQRCDLPEPSVAFSEGTGMSLQVSGLSIAITGLWNTRYGIIKDGGWFELVMFTVSLNTVLQLGREDGRLSISTPVCSADVESVQMNFHGGGSPIFQPFVKFFHKHITSEIRAKICQTFVKEIEALESHLAAMSVALKVDSYVYMNISLTDSPLVKDSGLGLNVKGEFYSNNFPSEPPFPSNHFELSWREDYMVSLGASEFFVNSAAYAYQRAGALKIRITDDMIPKASPFHLNTSQFGQLIPQLPKKYPDLPMQILLYASDAPLFSFNKTVINVNVSASAKAYAMKANSVAIPLFRLDVESSFSGKAYIDKYLLKGVLQMKNLTVTLGATEIGCFPVGPIEQALKLIMSSFVLPKLNAQLKDGLPLPRVKGFGLRNSVMTIENGFLALATDLSAPYGSWQ